MVYSLFTKALSIPEGNFETQLPLIVVKIAIVDASGKVVLLADHSKFELKSLCLSIPLEDIDTIITDNGLSPEILEILEK